MSTGILAYMDSKGATGHAMGKAHEGSLANKIYQLVLERILSGDLKAGEKIVIDRVAAEYTVSLIPVREALARLNAEGFVSHVANKGFQVAPAPTYDEYVALFRARLAMEYGALHIGFRRVSDEAISELEMINRDIAQINVSTPAEAFQEFASLNEEFHVALVSLSSSKVLLDAYDKISYRPQIGRTMYAKGAPDRKNNVEEHQAIIDALKNRNEKQALDALEQHILRGLDRFLETFEFTKKTRKGL